MVRSPSLEDIEQIRVFIAELPEPSPTPFRTRVADTIIANNI